MYTVEENTNYWNFSLVVPVPYTAFRVLTHEMIQAQGRHGLEKNLFLNFAMQAPLGFSAAIKDLTFLVL